MPDKPDGDKSTDKEISRRERLKRMGVDHPDMPPCETPYLVGYLFEIGPTMAAGAGEGPISNVEIASWQNNIGINLESWESRFLRRLSSEYLNESHRAREQFCSAPYETEQAAIDRIAQEERARMALKKLANQ